MREDKEHEREIDEALKRYADLHYLVQVFRQLVALLDDLQNARKTIDYNDSDAALPSKFDESVNFWETSNSRHLVVVSRVKDELDWKNGYEVHYEPRLKVSTTDRLHA